MYIINNSLPQGKEISGDGNQLTASFSAGTDRLHNEKAFDPLSLSSPHSFAKWILYFSV